jgi:uncharacterized protein YaaN involved in tellurite resistance
MQLHEAGNRAANSVVLQAQDSSGQGLTTLTTEQESKARELAVSLVAANLGDVHNFGRDASKRIADYSDGMLANVRTSDLDEVGVKLSGIVSVAQSLNLHGLSDQRSNLPVVGKFIDKLRVKKNDFVRQFEDVRTQVDTLVNEVDFMQQGLSQRVDSLEIAFDAVRQEHDDLAVYARAGEMALEQLQQHLAQDAGVPKDALQAQALQDKRQAVQVLDKRVADLRMLQHSALQQLPMIRMVQANSRMLVDKFHSIRSLTIPAWKRQFMLAMTLSEQESAVKLSKTVDDATNDFLKANAKLLKENTLATARANQRMVIDIETLRETHDTLISTVQEVMQINKEGAKQRQLAIAQLKGLQQSVVQQLGRPN